MTEFRFDHAVIVVRDLKTAIHDYTKLGFNVLPGGEHPAFNTHNALIPFADGSYLELLATKETMYFSYLNAALQRDILDDELPDDSLPTRRFIYNLARGEGIQDFALGCTDLAHAMAQAQVGGVNLEGPLPGSRTRADGTALQWEYSMARMGKLPFLINDLTPRDARISAEPAHTAHPNGSTGIDGIEVNLPDLALQVPDYAALLAQPATQSSVHAAFKLSDGTKIILRQSPEFTLRLLLGNPHVHRAQIAFGG